MLASGLIFTASSVTAMRLRAVGADCGTGRHHLAVVVRGFNLLLYPSVVAASPCALVPKSLLWGLLVWDCCLYSTYHTPVLIPNQHF